MSDDRLDTISQIWPRFPLPVCAACVHPDGIAATKVRNPRTGRQEVRCFVPSNPEIREWLNQYQADLHEIAKAGEIADRPVGSPPLVPEWVPPTPEEKAHVQARLQEYLDHVRRSSSLATPEQQREAAERFLEACRQE